MSSHEDADVLIAWFRDYASLRIDSRLADERYGFPPHVFLDLGSQGFFGMNVSPHYGGIGLKTADMLRVIEQIAAIDISLMIMIGETIQGANTLQNYATDSLREQYLPDLASGRIFASGAMTESVAGSNPRAMKSTATPIGKDEWLIKGSKRWVGLAASASIIAVYVQELDPERNWLGMSGFLIPQGARGLLVGNEALTMGIRGFTKHTVSLENVKVTRQQLLGNSGEGMKIAQDNMMFTRLCLAAGTIGVMKRCAQLMYRYASRRTIATGKLLDNPVTLVSLSELTAAIDVIENFVKIIAELYDKDPSKVPEEAYVVAKIMGSEYLGLAADMLVQTLGARGYEEANIAAQIFRDARAFRIFEGPTETLNMYIGASMCEQNPELRYFVCKVLGQKKIFDSIQAAVENVQDYCQTHKLQLFADSLTTNYWAQTLKGEVISYGLMLAAAEFNAKGKPTANTVRGLNWIRGKYEEAVQKCLIVTPSESTVVQSSEIKNIIGGYRTTIGNIEQIRSVQDVLVDDMLISSSEEEYNNNGITFDSVKLETKQSAEESSSPVLTKAQYKQILQNASGIVDKSYEAKFCHELFAQRAAQDPQAIAVKYEDQVLTYKDLNATANQLAHYLRKNGVCNDKLVAVYLERSPAMIIALLAVLKAGGAYVPLDHNYPKNRLVLMLKDSCAEVVITQKSLQRDLPLGRRKVILTDDLKELISNESVENPPTTINKENLAYVIYTSGTTGKPKGVMLPHNALSNLLFWHQAQINEPRNILQFTPLSFDMSFFEIFGALSWGGTLVLISENDRTDLLRLSEIIKKHSIQQLMLPVVFLKILAESNLDRGYFSSLREIITAGEQLIITPAIRLFFTQLPECCLYNYYGPSETHVVTAYKLSGSPADWHQHPPIGKPIANTKAIILDQNMQPVPIGIQGQLFLGGACLARGYLNNQELTQRKFIADLWSDNSGDRLYQTGDFAKYLPNGDIIFLGRVDEQVKIRGFRVELQEIESYLLKCPDVKGATVVVRVGDDLEKQLVAFIATNLPFDENFVKQTRAYLQNFLPPYMIPDVFQLANNMPLTPSGKIDRYSLEQSADLVTYSTAQFIKPKTKTEKNIVAILEGFFNIRVGINHSFISIGGNSLLAMQVISKIRDVFSVDFPACNLLSGITTAEIAKEIDHMLSLKKQKIIS